MPETSEIEPERAESEIHKASVVKQIVQNRDSTLDVVREALSNSFAREVNASEVLFGYYEDITYGTSFVVEDDGCGMDYTGNKDNPGRLDKFKNLGFSEVSGIQTDEFGYKGLGSKLMLDCRKLKVKTWTGNSNDPVYELRAENPRETLIEAEEPELPTFEIIKRDAGARTSSGTKIEMKGYGGGYEEFRRKDLKLYLFYRTIVGCTRENRARNFPKFIFNYMGSTEKLNLGFPWIEKENDWRTVTIDPPISKTVSASELGMDIDVTLKGGFTLNTGGQKFGLSPQKGNVGIFVSVKGIPYFRIPYNEYSGDKFKNVYKRFACFVVECDELYEFLKINRGGFNRTGDIGKAFRKACRQCFNELADREEYNEWIQKKRKESWVELAEKLQDRQEELQKDETEYVYLRKSFLEEDTSEQDLIILHHVPSGEKDTLALLWKLESLDVLPFEEYVSLEHTNQKGIDLIVNYKEDPPDQYRRLAPCEVETKFESFERHGHFPGQAEMIICWKIEHPNVDNLEQTSKEYKYLAQINDKSTPVYEMRKFPCIETRRGFEE